MYKVINMPWNYKENKSTISTVCIYTNALHSAAFSGSLKDYFIFLYYYPFG